MFSDKLCSEIYRLLETLRFYEIIESFAEMFWLICIIDKTDI